jgi:hypothetical protein
MAGLACNGDIVVTSGLELLWEVIIVAESC